MSIADLVAAVSLLTGSGLVLVAAIGLHRMPDLYARMHAATKTATLGFTLCVLAAAVRADGVDTRTKLALAIVFQFLTAPVAAHLLSRAAHSGGVDRSPHTVVDELDERGS